MVDTNANITHQSRFITVHGLNEGHIAPYTDIEFRLTKYQTYIIMKCWYKSLQLIIEETITLLTKIKHIKQMASPTKDNGHFKQWFTDTYLYNFWVIVIKCPGGLLTMFGVMGRLGPFDPPFSTYVEFWPLLLGVICRILTPFFKHCRILTPIFHPCRILTPIFINF